jgi:hypothetical protein
MKKKKKKRSNNDPSAIDPTVAINHQHLSSERLVVAAVQLTSPPSEMVIHAGSVPTSTPLLSASQNNTNTLLHRHHSNVHSFWTAAQEAVLQ